MLKYEIVSRNITKLKIDFEVIKSGKVKVEVKANTTLNTPKDFSSTSVLYDITFNASVADSEVFFIEAEAKVIMKFDEKPDYEEISKGECSKEALNNVIGIIDDILEKMGFPTLKFSTHKKEMQNN